MTTTTIPPDINLATTTLATTTQDTITLDTTTPIDITTGGLIQIIMKEVHMVRTTLDMVSTTLDMDPTTLDIIQDTTTALDIRMEIIKDIAQTSAALIRIIPATTVTILTTPLTTLLMTGSTTKDITKADTIIHLITTELMTLRKTRISK
jgi:hypothetical protein